MDEMIAKGDIDGRGEIDRLVDVFYRKVRRDDKLGFIFDEIAQVNWESHLPLIASFWETVLFRSGGYKGNPLKAHHELLAHTDMGRDRFDRWLELFHETVDQLFDGPNAGHIKRCADDMANVIHSKINQLPNPRFYPIEKPTD